MGQQSGARTTQRTARARAPPVRGPPGCDPRTGRCAAPGRPGGRTTRSRRGCPGSPRWRPCCGWPSAGPDPPETAVPLPAGLLSRGLVDLAGVDAVAAEATVPELQAAGAGVLAAAPLGVDGDVHGLPSLGSGRLADDLGLLGRPHLDRGCGRLGGACHDCSLPSLAGRGARPPQRKQAGHTAVGSFPRARACNNRGAAARVVKGLPARVAQPKVIRAADLCRDLPPHARGPRVWCWTPGPLRCPGAWQPVNRARSSWGAGDGTL
jgi:hypothetical protein